MNLSLLFSKFILHRKSFLQLITLKLFESYNKFFTNKTYRPEYEILIDYHLSKQENLDLENISIIEFGVASGSSLKYLEDLKQKIEKKYNIEIKIYGFDTFEGMPKSQDISDQIYDWKEGDYKADYEKVKSSLKYTKLIKGDIKDTINYEIFSKNEISNILVIIFDLDYYSSTSNAFKIFDNSLSKFLRPRVGVFFDNLHSSTEISGEYLSIKQFNEKNIKNNQIISKDFYLEKYDNRFYQYMNLNHKAFNINKKKKQIL